MDIVVDWQGGMKFQSKGPTGLGIVLDSSPEFGGEQAGPAPVEVLMASCAACSGMDVVSMLQKSRQEIRSYQIKVHIDRTPDGEYPRTITRMKIEHVISGENLNEAAVQRAVQLSDEKYCQVIANMRAHVHVEMSYRVG